MSTISSLFMDVLPLFVFQLRSILPRLICLVYVAQVIMGDIN